MNEAPGIFYNGDASAEKWVEFHYANPQVYYELRSLALKLVAKGHTTGAIGMLFEVVRWNRALRTTDEDFKLNNNYRAYYARLLAINEKKLANFFKLREQRVFFDVAQVRAYKGE